MTIQRPQGTRDFYPDEMARQRLIFDAWRRVSLRSGFDEMDGPALESLGLYTAKSGDEIVGQLFTIQPRGEGQDARYALRPELTPSLARMVNQRVQSMRLPIKWFSIPRLWRGETPQAGRLREFFQWNVDVVGSEETVADAECIYVAIDCLRELGLTADDVVVLISSRGLLRELLSAELDIPTEHHETVYAVLDKKRKLTDDEFRKLLTETLIQNAISTTGAELLTQRMIEFTECSDLSVFRRECKSIFDAGTPEEFDERILQGEVEQLEEVFGHLESLGVGDWCRFDLGIVRGLAYYTGPVFEIYDRDMTMRAVAGGGRYDNLLEVLGGPPMPAVGFGMGDVVLTDLLEKCGKLGDAAPSVDYFLIDADRERFADLLGLADRLRARGASAVFNYRRQGVSKQFKQASAAGARRVIIIGAEWADGRVSVKDLATGRQAEVSVDHLLDDPNLSLPIE